MSTDLDPQLEAALRSGLNDLAEAVFPDEHFTDLLTDDDLDDLDSQGTDDAPGDLQLVDEPALMNEESPMTSTLDAESLSPSSADTGSDQSHSLVDEGDDELSARRRRKALGWRPMVAAAAVLLLVAGSVTWLTRGESDYTIEEPTSVASRFDNALSTPIADSAIPPGETRVLSLGERVLVMGIDGTDNAIYDPETNTWTPAADAPQGRPLATLWTGTELIGLFVGSSGEPARSMWLSYSPELDLWRDLDAPDALVADGSGRFPHLELVRDELLVLNVEPWSFNTENRSWTQRAASPTLDEREDILHPASSSGFLSSDIFTTIASDRRENAATNGLLLTYDINADQWSSTGFSRGSAWIGGVFAEVGGTVLFGQFVDGSHRFGVSEYDPTTGELRQIWESKRLDGIVSMYVFDDQFVLVHDHNDAQIITVAYDSGTGTVGETLVYEWERDQIDTSVSSRQVGSAIVLVNGRRTAVFDPATSKIIEVGDETAGTDNAFEPIVVDDDTLLVWQVFGSNAGSRVIELGG